MVLQITTSWRKKVSSKVMAISQYTPDMFVKSQWQRRPGISLYYLIYRWVMASIFLSIMLASMMELGRPRGDFIHYAKWVIYLTHWGFTACTLQALLAAYLVTRAHCKQPEREVEAMKMNCTLRLYWILHHIATVGAFAITVIYWGFVFDPDVNRVDAINLLVHAGNSILMLMDLIIVSHPIRLVDFYWPLTFAILYVIFNFSYYLAGGTDRNGRTYIYKILDWNHPERTLIVVQFCLLFLLFLHVSVCLFCLLRCKIVQVLRKGKAHETDRSEVNTKNMQGATNEIPINDLA